MGSGPATVANLQGVLKEQWAEGIPREMYDTASPLYAMLAKEQTANWRGATVASGTKTLTYQYGIRSGLPSAGATTYNDAYVNPGRTDNDEVHATLAKYYTSLTIDHDTLDSADDASAQEVIIEAKALESVGHVVRTFNVLSKEHLSNGGGVIGRINGNGAALTGTTFTLKNVSDRINFRAGDRLQFATTNGLTGAPKAVVVTVVDDVGGNGVVTVTPALVGGDGVLDNDFVFRAGRFGAAFKGLFAWCPTDIADLSTNFFRLNQTAGKRGGHRIKSKKGGDPMSKVLSILRVAEEESAMIDCVVGTTRFIQSVIESTRFQNLSVRAGNGTMMKANPVDAMYDRYGYDSMMRETDAAEHMRYGVDGYCFTWPGTGRTVYLYGDKYLSDSSVAAKDDDLLIALNTDVCKLPTLARNGFGWQNHDGNGPIRNKEGLDEVAAVFGVKGQEIVLDPNDLIVSGHNVVPE